MKRGWTLAELLIVIAVIATLAALFLPVFAQAREQARATVCLSRTRQLGLAFRLYLDDWDRYPGAGRAERPYRGDWVRAPRHYQIRIEEGSLWPYARHVSLYRCPGDAPRLLSYAMNELLEWRAQSAVLHPSRTPLLVDQEPARNGRGGVDDGLWSPGFWPDRLTTRHHGGGTLLFADGHTERWQASRLDCGVPCRLALFAPD